MILNVEIINVSETTKPTAKGSYVQLDVAFKRLDTGKVEGKKVMSFTNKEVFSALQGAKNGQQLAITTEKNEKSGYWDWTAVNPLTGTNQAPNNGNNQPAKAGFAAPKSTYETAEERAARQVLIVRQSSIAQAVATLAATPSKEKLQVEDVLQIADTYNQWVFQKGVDIGNSNEVNIADMQDEIPY